MRRKWVLKCAQILNVIVIYLINYVVADYCAFGLCEEDEYCCGENICCKNSSGLWYLWVLGIISLFILFIVYIWIRFKRRTLSTNQYRPLSTNDQDIEVPISDT